MPCESGRTDGVVHETSTYGIGAHNARDALTRTSERMGIALDEDEMASAEQQLLDLSGEPY